MSHQENRSETTVPNLYKMLGLRGPDESGDLIRAKIDRLLKKAEAIAAKDPKKADQARKLAAVARKQLCDPSRKKKFDSMWQAQHGQSTTERGETKQEAANPSESAERDVMSKPNDAVNPERRSNLRPKFSALLPNGSPTEAFDLAAYLKVAPAPRFDRSQFEQMVASVVATAEPEALATSKQSEPSAFSAPDFAISEASPPELSRPPIQAVGNSAAIAPTAKKGLGKQLREKRKKSFLVPVLGLLGCMAIVLGLIAFLLRPQQPDDTVADSGTPAIGNAKGNEPSETNSRAPRRSGLPQVGMPTDVDRSGTVVDLRPAEENGPQTPDDMELFMPDSQQLDSLEPGTNVPDEPNVTPEIQPRTDPVMTDTVVTPSKPPAAPAGSIQETLKTVLQLASEYQYDEAVERIVQSREQALSDDQTVQLQRVETIVQLAQQSHASLVAKVKDMSAGESFLVGTSAQVAFVSGDTNEIAIRLRGQQRSYTYDKLPPGLLYALLDMALDRTNVTALAAQGAFILLQPNRTDATIRKARELLVTGAGSGAFEEDLPQVIADFGL